MLTRPGYLLGQQLEKRTNVNNQNFLENDFHSTFDMRWPLRNFYTFNHLVDSYRNTISERAMGFRYGNFTLKLARGKKSLASRGPTALGRQAFLPVG